MTRFIEWLRNKSNNGQELPKPPLDKFETQLSKAKLLTLYQKGRLRIIKPKQKKTMYKTYTFSALMFISAVLFALGWINQEVFMTLVGVFGAGGFYGLRSSIKK